MQRKNFQFSIPWLLAVCFLVLNVSAQNQTVSPSKKGKLSDIKDKKSIFVEVADQTTKDKIENLFRNDGRFAVSDNLSNAEIVFSAYITAESTPAFGTIERRTQLPALNRSERPESVASSGRSSFPQSRFDLKRKTLASVYYTDPNGGRIVVWSEQTLRINDSKEPAANIDYLYSPGEELYLAKEFLKDAAK